MAVYRSMREISCPISPAMLTTVVLLITCMNTNRCRAAVLLKSNATYQNCGNGGLADEYYCHLIAEDLELELLFDTHVSRMLQQAGGSSGSGIPGKPAEPCGHVNKGEAYCHGAARNQKKCPAYRPHC